MTKTLSKKMERFRHLAMLLVTLCGFVSAYAQESSDEINEAILVEGSVPVTWTNDAQHPWIVCQFSDGSSYVRTPDGDGTMTTTLECTYKSTYPTEITFAYSNTRSNVKDTDYLIIEIDGEETYRLTASGWNDSNRLTHIIPSGSHCIKFISASVYNTGGNYAGIRNLRVWECKEIEAGCLREGSMPLTFENDPDNIWITEDGYIRSTVQNAEKTTSKISTTFTIDKPSLFTYKWRNSSQYNNEVGLNVIIDGVLFKGHTGNTWKYQSLVLYPGEHTIEFVHWHDKNYSSRRTELRDVQLAQNWYDVTLNAPGELRTRLLQALGDKNLQDAELVKISGTMNGDDWNTIKQLTSIKAIDFTDTGLTTIPASACSGLGSLSTVILPETLVEIGDKAFQSTDFYRLTVPSSVERIGQQVWYQTPLQFIDFAENSKLKHIGYGAFYETRLIEFIMPDAVESIGRYNNYTGYTYECNTFKNCSSLKKLHLSKKLLRIPKGIAYNCLSLEDLEISDMATVIEGYSFQYTALKTVNLPESLSAIGERAFSDTKLVSLTIPKNVGALDSYAFGSCSGLKHVTLNSLMWNMNCTFSNSPAIETIVLPCATPPSIAQDPFGSINKDNVRLIVPDFAIDAYRGDPYWYRFSRNITSSNEASVSDYWGIRGNLTLDTNHVIQGAPSLDVYQGGSITFDTDTQQDFDYVRYYTSESSPGSFLSNSNAVKANGLKTCLIVESAKRWYFFSPVIDVNMSDVTYTSTDAWVIRYYDGARRASGNTTSGNWVNVPADGKLKRGQGYIFQAAEAGTLVMPAATSEHDKFFGNCEVELELADNACETPENAGWNFISNPYPCYYDIYYINMEAPITVWTGSTYRAYSLSDGDRGDNTLVLRPMQPFFVQKATSGLTAGMTLEGRRTSSVIDRSRAPGKVVVDENRHKLNLEFFKGDNEKADDYTSIVLNEKASLAYETVRDASKFMSMDTEVAQLYSIGDNRHPMAINERPYENGSVGLGVYIPESGETYRISARRADRKVWIFDADTGIEQDLTEGDYVFMGGKTGIDNHRFTIRFAPATTAVEGIDISDVEISGNEGSISVTAPDNSAVSVCGIDGSVIANTFVTYGRFDITVNGGVYVVKVNGVSYKTIVK